ncbi:MAG: tetratricopeptide repeat protein [Pikeienuella sp.]
MKFLFGTAFAKTAMAAALSLCCGAAVSADGLSGSYLAGRHAATIADVDQAGRYFARALARDPGNPGLMEQALVYQTAAGRVEQALSLARDLIDIQPDHRLSALVLTAEDIRAGNLDAAQARLSATPEAFHPLVGALLSAWTAHGLRQFEKVESAFESLDDRTIIQVFAGYHLGLIRLAEDDVPAAEAAFDKAMGLLSAPTGRMARGYAAMLRRADRKDEARKVYERAMSIAVGDAVLERELSTLAAGEPALMAVSTPADGAAEALFGLASALGQEGGKRLSLFYTRLALHLRPDFSDAALLTAELLEDQEQFALAVKAYESIDATNPHSRAAEIGRAEALHRMGEDDKAVEALQQLTRRSPEAVDAHIALGDLMRRIQRFAEGAQAYDVAVDLMAAADRETWVLYYQRGITLERSDQWERAEADFFKALELSPDQPLVLNYLGYSWLEKGLNLEKALPMIQKAVDQRPDDGYIVDSLGWAYYLRGDFENAVVELERAVELRPVDPVINDHLGDALWQVGRRLEAEFQWKRAMSFEPDAHDAIRIKRKLQVGLDQVLEEETVSDPEAAETVKDDG